MSVCVRPNGSPKVRYSTRAEARRAARLSRPDLGALSAYHCPRCGYFHIGHRQAETELGDIRVTVIQADGRRIPIVGRTETLTIDPCHCGLAREYVQSEPASDGSSTVGWACPDHGVPNG
jgi:hypothetical protein